jgi:hypothetical protein
MADGVINETSIGFDTVTDRVKDAIRHLVEVLLWDISPVTFAANEEATVLSVKSLTDLLGLGPDIDEAKLRAAIAALKALLPQGAEPITPEQTLPPGADQVTPDRGAVEAEQAMAAIEAIADGFDAREAEARIDEILARL